MYVSCLAMIAVYSMYVWDINPSYGQELMQSPVSFGKLKMSHKI